MRKPSLLSVAAAVVLVALVSCALATPSVATEVDATLAPAAEPVLVELTYVEPVDRDTEEEVELAREELAARVARLKQEQRDLARRAEIRRQLKKMQTMTQRSFRQLSLRRRAWAALDVNERCQRTRMQYNATEARIEKINKRRARNLVRRLRAADRKCTTAATQRCRHLFAYRIAKSTCERVACRVRHQFRGRYQMCEKNDACQDDLQRCIALKAQLRAKFRPCADNAVAKCVKRHRDRTDRREKRFVAKQAKKLALAKLRVAKECGLTK